ncbi:MAG: hypothetical protein ACKO0W_10740, partial [Planctomycetota bacterium]
DALPVVDKGIYLLAGDDAPVIAAAAAGDSAAVTRLVGAAVAAGRGWAVKVANPGGNRFWRQGRRGDHHDLDTPLPGLALTPRGLLDHLGRAVDSLGELREEPEKLGAMILRGDAIGGPVRRSAVSQAWGNALLRIQTARPGEVASILTTMLATIAKGTEGDSLFRVRALRDGAELAVNSGHFEAQVAQAVEAWLELMRRDAGEIVSVDWVRAAYENSPENRALRRKSADMIRRFPEIAGMVGSAEEEQRRLGSQLAPLAPIGVLLVAATDGAARTVAGDPPGRPVADGDVVLLVRDGTQWRMQDARVRDGRVATESLDVPAGPVLVFRRVNQ